MCEAEHEGEEGRVLYLEVEISCVAAALRPKTTQGSLSHSGPSPPGIPHLCIFGGQTHR